MIKKVRKNSEIIDKSDDKKISIALMSSFVILTIQYFILIYFDLLETTLASRIQLLSKILVGVAFIYAIPSVIKRNKTKLIITYLVATFTFLVNYLIFPENHLYLKTLLFPFFFMCMPAYIYSVSLSDWNVLKQIMKKASLIVFLFGSILGILIFFGKASAGAYSMSLSYYMLLPTVIFLDDLLDKLSLKAFLISLISILVILALGSRGALLCIVFFVVLKLIRFNFKLTNSKVYYNLIIISAIIITYIQLDVILESLYNLILNFGIKSRSILLFLQDDVSLSGRDNIYQNVIGEIFENPLLGIGLGADRHLTYTGYTHNFFLEVLANFGVFLGGIIIIVLMLLILKVLFVKDKERYSIVIIWMSLGFVHLMVSSSYLIDLKFWIFLGLITKSLTYRKSKVVI